jgi:hypothetical protein
MLAFTPITVNAARNSALAVSPSGASKTLSEKRNNGGTGKYPRRHYQGHGVGGSRSEGSRGVSRISRSPLGGDNATRAQDRARIFERWRKSLAERSRIRLRSSFFHFLNLSLHDFIASPVAQWRRSVRGRFSPGLRLLRFRGGACRPRRLWFCL